MAVADDVADAVAAGITALALTGVTVARRKVPTVSEGDTLPLAVVSIGEEQVEYLTATQVMALYPVAVTLVRPAENKLEDDDTLHDWRQQVRRKLEDVAVWSTVSGFDHVEAGGIVPFDVAALRQEYNYSPMPFRVYVIESRT